MRRRVERALIAKVGALVFSAALALPVMLSPASAQASVIVADIAREATAPDALASVVVELPELRPPPIARAMTAAASAIDDAPAAPAGPPIAAPLPIAAPPPMAAPGPTLTLAVATAAPLPPPEPLVVDGLVVASWYGPGFYGNRTACGQTYTPEILGVAHRLLPCGTPVRITSPAGITVVVPVIDRGPYVAGRSLDLSNATRIALLCSDLCRVRMTALR